MNPFGPTAVYALCLITSLVCVLLLTRSYLQTRSALLLCVALGFAAFALNNLLLVADRVLFPAVDLWVWRQLSLGLAIAILLSGFIWAREQ